MNNQTNDPWVIRLGETGARFRRRYRGVQYSLLAWLALVGAIFVFGPRGGDDPNPVGVFYAIVLIPCAILFLVLIGLSVRARRQLVRAACVQLNIAPKTDLPERAIASLTTFDDWLATYRRLNDRA